MIKQALAKILPKEDKFYTYINALAMQASTSARHLKAFVEAQNDATRAAAVQDIVKTRVESKKVMADITRELCLTFITPFDREDIQDFSYSLYKIIKTIAKICERLQVHHLSADKGLVRQTNLILQEVEAMQEMVHELISGHNSQRILSKVDTLYDLENKGDSILSELLGDLFRDENDIKKLIIQKDVYDMLEKVIDLYRDTAAVALQIVLKHS